MVLVLPEFAFGKLPVQSLPQFTSLVGQLPNLSQEYDLIVKDEEVEVTVHLTTAEPEPMRLSEVTVSSDS